MATRKRPPLTVKREEYVDGRAHGRLVGAPLAYNEAANIAYRKKLDALVRVMASDYQKELLATYSEVMAQDSSLASQLRIRLNALQAKWAKFFRDRAPDIVKGMMNRVDQAEQRALGASLKDLSGGLTLKTDIMPAALKEAMTASIAENVNLIKSIQSQYHTQIEGIALRSIQPGGRGAAEIKEGLLRYKGVTERRANFIAEDQTKKIQNAMNVERSKALGITKGKWLHSGGGKEKRPKHVAFSGKIFDLNDPPAIGDKGQKVMPATEPGCRCTFTPVLDW